MSAGNGQVNPQHLAYLHDRICYFEGRPQKYGTQFDNRGLYPVENKEEMIRLRKELQLGELDQNAIAELNRKTGRIFFLMMQSLTAGESRPAGYDSEVAPDNYA